jgi:AcrR family transcriptional regulator
MYEVVEAAADMLLTQPPDSIKMTDLAVRCEMGVASLYRYFGTKSVIIIKAGSVLWKRMKSLFEGVFECGYYKDKNGLGQLSELMKVFKVMYLSHKDFLRFVDSFDRFVIANGIGHDQLEEYESSITDFYALFEEAYKKGCADGSVKQDIDFRIMYLSVTHALMLMSEKFALGGIFENETAAAERELDFLINMAIAHISGEG